jgi:hypothetical protein
MSVLRDIACHSVGDLLNSGPLRCLQKVHLEKYERLGLDPCGSFCSVARIGRLALWVESVYCWLLRIDPSWTALHIYHMPNVLSSLDFVLDYFFGRSHWTFFLRVEFFLP